MATFLLIISSILFIATFGIHVMIIGGDPIHKPRYTDNALLSAIPWISGFVVPVIPLTIVLEINWLIVFFINLAVVWILGPVLTEVFLARFATGRGFGRDLVYSFIGGIVTLIIGLVLR
jgi:hypothetical protein